MANCLAWFSLRSEKLDQDSEADLREDLSAVISSR